VDDYYVYFFIFIFVLVSCVLFVVLPHETDEARDVRWMRM